MFVMYRTKILVIFHTLLVHHRLPRIIDSHARRDTLLDRYRKIHFVAISPRPGSRGLRPLSSNECQCFFRILTTEYYFLECSRQK